MNNDLKNYAIILASGTGKRFGSKIPKQFEKICGKTILEHSVNIFEQNNLIDAIIVVINTEYVKQAKEILKDFKKIVLITAGGKTRKESSCIGVNAIKEKEANVFIHDCARPLLSQKTLNNCISAIKIHNAVTVACPLTDTVIKSDGDYIEKIPERKSLKKVQTPQAFKLSLIKKAHNLSKNDENFTDDCGLIIKHDLCKIFIVDGDAENIKITYPNDIYIAEKILKEGL